MVLTAMDFAIAPMARIRARLQVMCPCAPVFGANIRFFSCHPLGVIARFPSCPSYRKSRRTARLRRRPGKVSLFAFAAPGVPWARRGGSVCGSSPRYSGAGPVLDGRRVDDRARIHSLLGSATPVNSINEILALSARHHREAEVGQALALRPTRRNSIHGATVASRCPLFSSAAATKPDPFISLMNSVR